MTLTTASDVRFDHKQWFHDIDRWNFYLQSWQAQIQDMTHDYRRLQEMVDQYAEDLIKFGDEIGIYRKCLVADERAIVKHCLPIPLEVQLVKSHESNTVKHAELYRVHEKLQQMQHTLSMGLAVLKHEPFRGE